MKKWANQSTSVLVELVDERNSWASNEEMLSRSLVVAPPLSPLDDPSHWF